jgi:hypothetical protein
MSGGWVAAAATDGSSVADDGSVVVATAVLPSAPLDPPTTDDGSVGLGLALSVDVGSVIVDVCLLKQDKGLYR